MADDLDLVLAPALSTDLSQVEQLLASSALPLAGLHTQFPQAYVVARAGDAVIGVAGLETHADACLLRSLSVDPGHRLAGLGQRLVRDRLAMAGQKQRPVFLLTTTAAEYFGRFGFSIAARDSAPAGIAASIEFAEACPASAAFLVWRPQNLASFWLGRRLHSQEV